MAWKFGWPRRKRRIPSVGRPYAPADTQTALDQRRRFLDDDSGRPPPGSFGLALSGGGIRSATISIGAVQALVACRRFLDFDYLSTVSGGGYAGTFLTSLFMPGGVRGSGGTVQGNGGTVEAMRKRDWALDALKLPAFQSVMKYGDDKSVRSPVWWLREHSRYLAPNGPTDFFSAVTYFIRAWLAMLYVFALPIAALAIVDSWAEWNIIRRLPAALEKRVLDWVTIGSGADAFLISPLLLLAAVILFLSLAAGTAYWQTEWMPRVVGRRGAAWWLPVSARTGFAVGIAVSTLGIGAVGLLYEYYYRASLIEAFRAGASFPARFLAVGLLLALTSQAIAILVYLKAASRQDNAFAPDVRMALTRTSTNLNQALMIIILLAAAESIALFLQAAEPESFSLREFSLVATILPAAAWLINFGSRLADNAGRWRRWLERMSAPLTTLLGLLLFALLIVAIYVLMHWLAYPGRLTPANVATIGGASFNLLPMAVVVTILIVATGWSTGFINLSSLHNLYMSRLTRAYLGGSNVDRLLEVAAVDQNRPITDSHARDDIDLSLYQQQRSAAPLHLINVTLNETQSHEESQIIERDRKGVPLVFAPEGVFVNAGRDPRSIFSWSMLEAEGVERLSAGQLCAISGAAASTGMGAHTTLGMALTMSFANIRLGYWWRTDDLMKEPLQFRQSPVFWLYLFVTKLVRTYFYLFNEMTARYSRANSRLYLSDGGHFDNSGVYELLRRGVPVILALDNGADPKYEFVDLENLVRKARLDLGLSVNVASRSEVEKLLGKRFAAYFLNGVHEDWRTGARTPGGLGVALLLKVYDAGRRKSPGSNEGITPSHYIVWVKPRVPDAMPQDVDGYALAHPSFPHEPTSNQFFNEAQWESYRALGWCHIIGLFGGHAPRGGILRLLFRKLQRDNARAAGRRARPAS
jgi:hypothetical protein